MTVGIVQSAHGMILSLKWAISTPSHVGFKIQRAQRQKSFSLEWIQLKLLKYYLHIILLLLYVMKPTTYAVHTLKILLSQNNVISNQSVNWQCKGAKTGYVFAQVSGGAECHNNQCTESFCLLMRKPPVALWVMDKDDRPIKPQKIITLIS